MVKPTFSLTRNGLGLLLAHTMTVKHLLTNMNSIGAERSLTFEN